VCHTKRHHRHKLLILRVQTLVVPQDAENKALALAAEGSFSAIRAFTIGCWQRSRDTRRAWSLSTQAIA
jgi:hypothetical protein